MVLTDAFRLPKNFLIDGAEAHLLTTEYISDTQQSNLWQFLSVPVLVEAAHCIRVREAYAQEGLYHDSSTGLL